MARRTESSVFFPWERQRGVLGRTRVQFLASAVAIVAALIWLRSREQQAAAVRATRASIGTAESAVMAYRADRGGCPKDLSELVREGYARQVPVDGWGRPLRLLCPGRRDPKGFDLSSDGPDGLPGGLDRVE